MQCIDLVLNTNKFLLPHWTSTAYSPLAPTLCNASLVPKREGLALQAKGKHLRKGRQSLKSNRDPSARRLIEVNVFLPLPIFSRHPFPKPHLPRGAVQGPRAAAHGSAVLGEDGLGACHQSSGPLGSAPLPRNPHRFHC